MRSFTMGNRRQAMQNTGKMDRKLVLAFMYIAVFHPAVALAQQNPPAPPSIADPSCFPTPADYPNAALQQSASGTTRIRYEVDAAGVLVSVSVSKSSGPTEPHLELDALAVAKLRSCSFKPAIDSYGKAVGGVANIDFVWRVPGREALPDFIDREACVKPVREYLSALTLPLRELGTTFEIIASQRGGRPESVLISVSAGTEPAVRQFEEFARDAFAKCLYRPAYDSSGNPVRAKLVYRARWLTATSSRPARNSVADSRAQLIDREGCLKPIWAQAYATNGLNANLPTSFDISVAEDGQVTAVEITKAAGSTPQIRAIESVAAIYIKNCKFQPARTEDGLATPSKVPLILSWPKWQPKGPSIIDLKACAPKAKDYQPAALRAEAEGTTGIKFSVDEKGRVVAAEVVRSSGPSREHRLLDRIALDRLSECTFGPGLDDKGTPVGGTFTVEYVWKIERKPNPAFDVRYISPAANTSALKILKGKYVGHFSLSEVESAESFKAGISCRLATIKPTYGIPLDDYVREAMVNDLKLARLADSNEPELKIGMRINNIEVKTLSDSHWKLGATFYSVVHRGEITIEETHNYEAAPNVPCPEAIKNFPAALASLFLRLYSHPDFPKLAGLVERP